MPRRRGSRRNRAGAEPTDEDAGNNPVPGRAETRVVRSHTTHVIFPVRVSDDDLAHFIVAELFDNTVPADAPIARFMRPGAADIREVSVENAEYMEGMCGLTTQSDRTCG